MDELKDFKPKVITVTREQFDALIVALGGEPTSTKKFARLRAREPVFGESVDES